jgi:hypothetical protein
MERWVLDAGCGRASSCSWSLRAAFSFSALTRFAQICHVRHRAHLTSELVISEAVNLHPSSSSLILRAASSFSALSVHDQALCSLCRANSVKAKRQWSFFKNFTSMTFSPWSGFSNPFRAVSVKAGSQWRLFQIFTSITVYSSTTEVRRPWNKESRRITNIWSGLQL